MQAAIQIMEASYREGQNLSERARARGFYPQKDNTVISTACRHILEIENKVNRGQF